MLYALVSEGRIVTEPARSIFEATRRGAFGFIRYCWMMNNGRGGYWYKPYPNVTVVEVPEEGDQLALAIEPAS